MDVDGKPFMIEEVIGDGFFGAIFLASADGVKYALKEVKQGPFNPKAGCLVKDYAKQCKEMQLEIKMQKWLREHALKMTECCTVPEIVASNNSICVMEMLDAVMFQEFLRGKKKAPTHRHFDAEDAAAEAANIKNICWVVTSKICKLMMALREQKFSHRDCQDNNVMIKIHETPVTKASDVSVYLIDFGKSMGVIDGEMIANGIYDPKDSSKYISPYNASSDTVRFIMSLQRSLLKSYEEAKWDASKGKWEWTEPAAVPDEWFIEHMPFADLFAGWFEYAKAGLGSTFEVNPNLGTLEDARGPPDMPNNVFEKKGKKVRGIGWSDEKNQAFIDFTRADVNQQRAVLFPYFACEAEDGWYGPLMPEAIVAACPPELSGATPTGAAE